MAQFGTTTISQNGEVYSDEIAVVKYGGLTGTKYAVNAPITDYPDNVIVEERVNYSNARLMNLERDTGLYDLAGVVETFSSSTSSYLYAYQKFTSTNHKRVFYRNWDSVNTNWSKWQSDQTVNIANLDYEINAPITAFPVRSFTYIKVRSMDALDYDLPGAGSIEVYRDSEDSYSYQKFTPVTRVGNGIKYRGWDITNNVWGKWNEVDGVEFTEIGDYPINAPITDFPIDKLIYLKVRLADASGYNLIRDTFVNGLYGKIEVHRDLEESYSYQKFISTGSNYEFYRKWDTSKNDWGNWGYNGITQYTKAEDYVVNAPMTDFPMNKITRLKVKSADAVGYGLSSGGIIEVYRDSENYYSYQKVISPRTNTVMYRYWIEPSLTWSDWQKPV